MLSKQYSDEIEHETSMLGSVIEPLMIVFLGMMVAVILGVMYLPKFKLGSPFGLIDFRNLRYKNSISAQFQ